ncbi:MAG: accessory factor associated with RNA polymerase II [Alectoria sarmentosa]|nr:MAG: accessory factor associated with RNA polymerase II [Alectoria sarmentosa]
MPNQYSLLLDEAVYEDMVQNHYDSSKWMGMQPVLAEATEIPRSKKKLNELCKKGAIVIGDTLMMRKIDRDGTEITFSATIVAFDQHSLPIMRTTGNANGNTWTCAGPNEFDEAMVKAHNSLDSSCRKTWDAVYVTRNTQELGNLYLFRQCLELYEKELEKWGCNGLGEEVEDRLSRALRGSDLTSSNSTPSPLTTSINYLAAQRRVLDGSEGGNSNPIANSPSSSPSALVTRQRPKQADRRSYHSDASAASPREPSNVSSPSSEVPLIIEEKPTPLRHRSASESSSVSSRTRRLLGLPAVRITPDAGSEQPPAKARSGFKWKREFSGRWLEIRIGRREQSAEHLVKASGEATPIPLSQRSTIRLPLSQTSTITDPDGRDRSSHAASEQRLLPESRDSLEYAILTPREGLYCRTKRALGLKRDPIDPNHPESRERTATDNLLDRVSSTLRFLPDRRTPSPSSATSVSNLSIAAPRWQRIMSRHGKIGLSTSSSIRETLMGKPPIHTPVPQAMYTGPDSKKYVAVDMTEDGMAFLPSEARRIHTPPLPNDATSPSIRNTRGFFFDYNAPPAPTFPDRPADANAQVLGPRRDSDWYRVKMNAIEAETTTREQLALSVPEHLPNSPLCPKHPKHKSGGTGECPYHGRNPSLPKETDMSSPKTSPSGIWW